MKLYEWRSGSEIAGIVAPTKAVARATYEEYLRTDCALDEDDILDEMQSGRVVDVLKRALDAEWIDDLDTDLNPIRTSWRKQLAAWGDAAPCVAYSDQW
jgi:hypothetical protein